MNKEELAKVLENHMHWLNEDCDGCENMKADLRDANLGSANLRYADLRDANLRDADLRYANLCNADLRYTDLRGAKMPFIPYVCPDFGSFIGYKKAYGDVIVELEILADAKRLSATSRKCRCDKAKVLRILDTNGNELGMHTVASKYDRNFKYKVGEIVSVDDFDENRWNECAPGIHFFINFQEAVNYN